MPAVTPGCESANRIASSMSSGLLDRAIPPLRILLRILWPGAPRERLDGEHGGALLLRECETSFPKPRV